MRCAHCQRPLTGSTSKGRTGRYSYYHCPKCRGANRVRTSKEALEAAFVELLSRLQPNCTDLRLFRAIVAYMWKSEQDSVHSQRKAVERRIENLKEQADRLDRSFIFEGAIDKPSYQRQRDRLRAETTVAELELGEARIDELEIEGVLAFAEYVFGKGSWPRVASAPIGLFHSQDGSFCSSVVVQLRDSSQQRFYELANRSVLQRFGRRHEARPEREENIANLEMV